MEENISAPISSRKNFSPPANFTVSIFVLVLLFLALYFIPWNKVRWGKLEFSSPQTITVIGTAQSKEKTQIATFTAGVSHVSDNKEEAISQVNKKVQDIINAALNFGIEKADIQTENLNIYQQEETYWEDNRQKTRPGQWRVSNNVSIVLRDVDKASEFAKVLSQTGATNVYGPNFSLENTDKFEDELLKQAIENAKEKAQKIASATDRKLGKIISVSEGYSSYSPIYPAFRGDAGGGGGVPIEPGSQTVSKTVTVVFELQ